MTDYLFNSAALETPYQSEGEALEHLTALLTALASLDPEDGPLPSLRMNQDPWVITLIDPQAGHLQSLGEVVNSMYDTARHDLAAFFDSLLRTVPSDSGIDDALIDVVLRLTPKEPALNHEHTFASVEACEIESGLCAVCGFVLISLLREDRWSYDLLGFAVGSEIYLVDHVATLRHAKALTERRLQEVRGEIKPGSFWAFKDKAFPRISFGIDVATQISKLNTVIFPLLLKRLAELDERTAAWQRPAPDPFPPGVTQIKPETDKTMNKYGTARNFRGADGQIHTYEEHLWIDTGHRIHIIRDRTTRSLEVGYIGHHLPTMLHPT